MFPLPLLKGVPLKLLAFERLLEKNPSLKDKLHFMQFGLKEGCHRWKLNAELHSRTIQEVKMIIDRLNAKVLHRFAAKCIGLSVHCVVCDCF